MSVAKVQEAVGCLLLLTKGFYIGTKTKNLLFDFLISLKCRMQKLVIILVLIKRHNYLTNALTYGQKEKRQEKTKKNKREKKKNTIKK